MQTVLIKLLLVLAGQIVTKEHVKAILDFIFSKLNEKVKNTDSQLDDNALLVVEAILSEDELVNELTAFIQNKIKK